MAEASVVHDGPLRLSAVIACYKDAQAIPLMHKRRPKFIRKAVRQGGECFNTVTELETFLRRRSGKTAEQRSPCARSFDDGER